MAQILVVDDSATVRNEVSTFLTQHGLAVEVAVDGKDGLDKLKRDSSIKLVISDVNMWFLSIPGFSISSDACLLDDVNLFTCILDHACSIFIKTCLFYVNLFSVSM